MSSALINDYPITFLPHLAKAIGVNEALVLQQLHYWLVNHAEMQHDGKFWIYKTYEEWQEQDFFFWSVRTVKSIFKKLGDMGLIESQKLSSNRHNRVNYYTINSVKLAEISAICEAEFEAKRLAKLAKKGGKPCTADSANLAQSQGAESAQSQGANPAQCLREQEENNKENTTDTLSVSFDDFWNLYDKKRGDKDKIEKKWQSLKDSEREAIMNHLPLYKKSQPNKKYRKNPSTYLNNKSWNDEIIFDDGQQPVSHDFHPSHIVSAPVIDDAPKLSREEKLARIAQIERGEI